MAHRTRRIRSPHRPRPRHTIIPDTSPPTLFGVHTIRHPRLRSGVSFSVIPFSTPGPSLYQSSTTHLFYKHFHISYQRRTYKGHNPLRHTAKTALSPPKTNTTQRKAPLSTASVIFHSAPDENLSSRHTYLCSEVTFSIVIPGSLIYQDGPEYESVIRLRPTYNYALLHP